jgi:AhpD family alkylhydroperoxidase
MTQTTRPRVREAPFGYTTTLVPGAKEALTAFSAAVWNEEGTVPAKTKELVFLRTSIVNRCEACTRAHKATAKRRGVTDEQITALSNPEQWEAQFTPAEIVLLDLSDRMINNADDLGPELIARLREHYNDGQIAELLLVAGQANMNNRAGEAAKQLFSDR